jgi:hypothetical protein
VAAKTTTAIHGTGRLSNQSPTVFPIKKRASQRHHNPAAAESTNENAFKGISARPFLMLWHCWLAAADPKIAAIALADDAA